MQSKFIKIAFITFYSVVCLFIASYADEIITGFEDKDLPILNDELRLIRDASTKAKDLASSDVSGILSTSKGGTGKSSWTQYLIPYADTTTSFSQLAIGSLGQVLTSNGAGSAPSFQTISAAFSNVVFCWTGVIPSAGVDAALYEGTSLTPTVVIPIYQFLFVNNVPNFVNKLQSKFTKISGISTLTVWCQIWHNAADGGTASCQVTVGAANGNVTGTVNQVTPEWKSFTIDVSGLSNGTTYDLGVDVKGGYGYLGAIIITSS